MHYTFLHISDIHYRTGWHEESEVVLNSFIEDMTNQIGSYENVFAVVSGDLVYAGAEAEYYKAFQKRLCEALDKVGLGIERRICIPGNHDVSRKAIELSLMIQKGALAEITDEFGFNGQFPQLSKHFFNDKFANYVDSEPKIAAYTCCQTQLGGAGWTLPGGLQLYLLNTALCSFGGLEDPKTGVKISDKGKLFLNTRSLHQWLQEVKAKDAVLVMHHPLNWLADWARVEIGNMLNDNFCLLLNGHIHEGDSIFSTRGRKGSVSATAPALFTKKSDALGYSFVSLDVGKKTVKVSYRQKTPAHRFVTGTVLADNDTGTRSFPLGFSDDTAIQLVSPSKTTIDTHALLEEEFHEACTCYSSKRRVWVNRDLSLKAETDPKSKKAEIVNPIALAEAPRSCVIRSPKEFGLSSLGRMMSLKHYDHTGGSSMLLVCDVESIPHHRQGVLQYVKDRCAALGVSSSAVRGVILDNWNNAQNGQKILRLITEEFPSYLLIILQACDDFADIANTLVIPNTNTYEIYYLWSLSRVRVREIVEIYLEQGGLSLDEDIVTKKIIEDIDALNVHRTPLNCLLILKLVERAFDDSPVNRTEVIGKVLYFLFHEYDQIPTYATRPDLKDCEFALGYLCEWMIRSNKRSFTRSAFNEKVNEYCKEHLITIDIDVLFAFLVTENIFLRKGVEFSFRLTYWLYYFAAHRMHHNKEFADFVLSDFRYASFPEVIEFYTGIDRMRTDAVTRLTADLNRLDADFLNRSKISPSLNPFEHALWLPDPATLERLRQEVLDSVQDSALPSAVKHAIADKTYDRSKPYNQQVREFITTSSLDQMLQAMRGAARALRNSDHVSPAAKMELLDGVIRCWVRMCQILFVLSPVLASQRRASFDGMGFYLGEGFGDDAGEKLWQAVTRAIIDNVITWYQLDIFSKKLGALFIGYTNNKRGTFHELLVMLLLVRQRPIGWDSTVQDYILRTHKNSFYLAKVYLALRDEFTTGFSNEQTRQRIRNLAAMAVARHQTGVKKPNADLIARAAAALDESIASQESTSEETS